MMKYLWLTFALILTLACQAISATTEAPPPSPPTMAAPESTHPPLTTSPANDSSPLIGGCPIFPADNFWNTRVDNLPIDSHSDAWINSIGRGEGFHMDFGSGEWDGGPIGIPYNVVHGASTQKFTPDFYYPDESDAGPYPIPSNPIIEYGSDHHILIVDSDTCHLYEIYDASFNSGQWSGGSGAIWDLNSNALRPAGWTSADAAGLPIFPGLVRWDEVSRGVIDHALRFTVAHTRRAYVYPARHFASSSDNPAYPPMGLRVRLKAGYSIAGFPQQARVILTALKRYGMM